MRFVLKELAFTLTQPTLAATITVIATATPIIDAVEVTSSIIQRFVHVIGERKKKQNKIKQSLMSVCKV